MATIKRAACIGHLSDNASMRPADAIVTLYNELRINNTRQNIKGIFLVSNDALLFIMEGEPSDLALCLYKLRNDERLADINLIASHDITTPLFSNWQIRFFKRDSELHMQYFEKIHKHLHNTIKFSCAEDKTRYQAFLPGQHSHTQTADREASHTTPTTNASFADKLLMIRSWPKPTQMKLTPRVMRACSLLSSRKIPYNALLQSQIWESEQLLKQFLQDINQLGILVIQNQAAQLTNGSNPNLRTHHSSETDNRFSNLLKKFITPSETRVS